MGTALLLTGLRLPDSCALLWSLIAGITGAGAAGWELPHLTSLQLQNSPGVDDAGVAALAGLTALRR